MRMTLALDDDVLMTAKAIAHQERRTNGDVVSDLTRRALSPPASDGIRNGIALLARNEDRAVVTLETVNALRDHLA